MTPIQTFALTGAVLLVGSSVSPLTVPVAPSFGAGNSVTALVVELQVEVVTGEVKTYEASKEVILTVQGKDRVFQIDSETKFQEATGRDNPVLADGPWWSKKNLSVTVTFRADGNKAVATVIKLDVTSVPGNGGGAPASGAGAYPSVEAQRLPERPVPAGAPIKVGQKLPEFRIVRFDGKTLSKTNLSGKVVLIDFWATWCGPCQMASPVIQSLHENYGKKGLFVLGADCREPDTKGSSPSAKAKKFVRSEHLTYTFAAGDTLSTACKAPGYPFILVVDKKGIVRRTELGFTDDLKKNLSLIIEKLLKE